LKRNAWTEFDDIFITSIGGDTNTTTELWGVLLGFQPLLVGGCQQQVQHGSDILFAFDAFNAVAFLKLELKGPAVVPKNRKVKFRVTDGMTGDPTEGAMVNEGVTDADGYVVLQFAKAGVHGVKAHKEDTIRSNEVRVNVV
jgi:hypothetical protein